MTADPTWRAVAARAASLLLRYPDEPMIAAMPAVRSALPGLPTVLARPLWMAVEHRMGADPAALRGEYVELFDFRRRCCLYLTYYTCGDTRRRGEALAGFAAAYKAVGLAVVDGELPDFLPAVLDLAAVDEVGWQLLRDNRVGLDLLVRALAEEGSAYQFAVEAIRRMLPPAEPAELARAALLARDGPPMEQVGLEPYGPVDTTGTVGGRR